MAYGTKKDRETAQIDERITRVRVNNFEGGQLKHPPKDLVVRTPASNTKQGN